MGLFFVWYRRKEYNIIMNKKLKFDPHLISLILSKEKFATWRLWDDKDLSVGDVVDFLNSETKQLFAVAKLTKIIEKRFADLTQEDKIGHEKYDSPEKMYQLFSENYKKPVGPDTLVKVVWYDILT